MAYINDGFLDCKVELVKDDEYLKVVQSLISKATQTCICSLFIVDICPIRDKELIVDDLLQSIRAAAYRGVVTKLLIGGSRTNLEIALSAAMATSRAIQLGIPCKWLTNTNRNSNHMKLVISDNLVLCGSHNWSIGAFLSQTQDSVLIESFDLASYCLSFFNETWQKIGANNGSV